MANRLLKVALMVAALLAAVRAGYGADIARTDNKLCAFKLQGTISADDYSRFAQVISGSSGSITPYDSRTSAICLNSKGGLYVEALKIAELMYARGISTVIEFGAECFSACAIIFMAGVSSDRLIPLRQLSAGGILGFHAPYPVMTAESYSKAQAESIAQAMREATLALLTLSSKRTQMSGGEFLKKSLISKIMGKGPQDVFFVSKISEAARWDILIHDAAEYFRIEASTARGIQNICANFHYANMDEMVPPVRDMSIRIDEYSSRFHRRDSRVLVLDNSNGEILCEIYPRESMGKVSFFACSYDYWSSRNFGNCRDYKSSVLFGKFVPDYFALDPAMPLKKFAN